MATDRDRRKPISAADLDVLARYQAAKLKGEPTCKRCFLKYPEVNEDGLCPSCEPTKPRPQIQPEDYSGLPESVQDYVEKSRRRDIKEGPTGISEQTYFLEGPVHSPGYIGSIKANAINDGLEHKIINTGNGQQLIPHPEAIGSLPVNHTQADYEHYVNARNGNISTFDGGQIDLRTPDQKDPNHRLYLPDPLLGPIPNSSGSSVKYSKGVSAGGKEERRGRVFKGLSNEANEITTEHTLNPSPSFERHQHVMRINAAALMSPREIAEHEANHVTKRRVPAKQLRAVAGLTIDEAGKFGIKVDYSGQYADPYVRSYPGTVDEKGNFWEEEPSTCHLCNVEHAINDATAEHDDKTGHGIAGDNPLCEKC